MPLGLLTLRAAAARTTSTSALPMFDVLDVTILTHSLPQLTSNIEWMDAERRSLC